MPTKPGFTDAEARAGWDTGAEAWEAFVESGADYYRTDVHGPGLLAACGTVTGLRVLDLGCGQGYFSRQLAAAGATVTGVDLSEAQIAFARAHEEAQPLGIRYYVMSAQDVNRHWSAGDLDMVTACMALHDMGDVPATFKSASRVLQPGGRLVASIPHPLSDLPVREWERDAEGNKLVLKVDRYFDSGPRVCTWSMSRLLYHWETPYWRYTLEEWSAMILKAGFLIRRMMEPCPTPEQVAARPELDDCSRMPYFLVLDLVKEGT